MNSTAPTKPVMDVALPKRPVSAPAHTVRKQTAATASVTPAPRKPLAPALRTRMTKDTSAAASRSECAANSKQLLLPSNRLLPQDRFSGVCPLLLSP